MKHINATDHPQQPHTADGGHYVVGGSAVPTSSPQQRKPKAMPIDFAIPDEDHPTARLADEMEEDSIRAMVAWLICLVASAGTLGFVLGFSFEKLAG